MSKKRRKKHFKIHKASGREEFFSKTKLRKSLTRAGIKRAQAQEISEAVRNSIDKNASSQEVYQQTVKQIKEQDPVLAMRYQLKRAIMDLGPSGYPFERYIGEVLKYYGYTTLVGQYIYGHCVRHEVDVVAEKKGRHVMIECKYHNHRGVKSDLRVALYTWSRYLDVLAAWKKNKRDTHQLHEAWIVTNTKATSDAIVYGRCVGMKIVGWSYPNKGNLQQIIEDKALYPVTILASLNNWQRKIFLQEGLVLINDVLDEQKMKKVSKKARLSSNLVSKMQSDASKLCASCGIVV